MIAFARRGPALSHGNGVMDGPPGGPIVRFCGVCGGSGGRRNQSTKSAVGGANGLIIADGIEFQRICSTTVPKRSASRGGCLFVASRRAFAKRFSGSEFGSSDLDGPRFRVTPPRMRLPGSVQESSQVI